jgi:hypothetical protein
MAACGLMPTEPAYPARQSSPRSTTTCAAWAPKVEATKLVIDRIIREHKLSGHEFATFGDGPVEIRETHQRARLIRGGAGLLVADFSQVDRLLKLLNLA